VGNRGSTLGNDGGGGAHRGTSGSGEAEKGFEVAAFFSCDGAPVGPGGP
jgi:hypothetical protein